MCEKSGVNVAFDSSDGSLTPPAILILKDQGSTATITVDAQALEKNGQAPLKPGSKVSFGDLQFQARRPLPPRCLTPSTSLAPARSLLESSLAVRARDALCIIVPRRALCWLAG